MANTGDWIIGSSLSCDVVVNEKTVSARHCRLTAGEGRFLLEDLSSTNGTWVNGKRIIGRATVTPADQIMLGNAVSFPWTAIGVKTTGTSPGWNR